MYRRVPQLVGMYIAATWLVIELGDWITERFNLPAEMTTYVFVAMLVMLPAVILFAYNHGAPGKDEWTRSEKVFIPLNAFVACAILFILSPQLEVEAATETVQIPDETGVVQEFDVARQGYHKDVVAFFWPNESGDSDLDWMSYGLPLMLAHDLGRVSPVLTVETPFDSAGLRNELRNKGYPLFLNEPQGLRVEIARDRRSAALIVGRFSELDGSAKIDITVVDTASGNALGTHSITSADWLAAVDSMTEAVLDDLEIEPSDNQSDDPIGQHFSDSLEAIEHFTNGHAALDLDNDYAQGIAEFSSAVELDPEFAEASGVLSMAQYLNSDIESARVSASQALRNDYRLSETSKFRLKANRYIYDGDYDRGERVIEIWTQVQPNSTDALASMARINRMRGTSESLDKASAAYDRLLELDPNNYQILRQKAEVEQQRGNNEEAATYLRTFLEVEPDSADGHLQLANVYQALGNLEAAQATLEDAAILSDSAVESELGLARLEARRGLFADAERRLEAQLQDGLDPRDRLQVIGAQAEVAFLQGRIEHVITLQEEISEIARDFMPPMVRLMSLENQRPGTLVLVGRIEEALTITDDIAAQLQPPIDAYLHFTYSTIYEAAGDERAYRDRVQQTLAARTQLPPIFDPFIEMQLARVAIWDDEPETARVHIDRARDLLGQSFVQLFHNNLSTSSLFIMLAELYYEAGAYDQAREQLVTLLNVFPANAHARLVYAKVLAAEGEESAAHEALTEALQIWSGADADYILTAESRELMNRL